MSGSPPEIRSLLEEGRRRLAAAPFRPSTREALLLLGMVLERSEAQLLAASRDRVTSRQARAYRTLLERRLRGEPVAYLKGEKEFYGRSFWVDSRVLIPRPETEHLVEIALRHSLPTRPWLLDLGTGSGCLAVTLALELPGASVVGVDLSLPAVALAAANIRRHGVESEVHLLSADWAASLEASAFHLVVVNPPYLAPEDEPLLSPEVRGFEPPTALLSSPRATSALDRLLSSLVDLRQGVSCLCEIGHGQAEGVRAVARARGFEVESFGADYAGIPRVATLRRVGAASECPP